HDSQIKMILCVVVSQMNRLAVFRDRIIDGGSLLKSVAEIVVRLWEIRFESAGFAELGDGALHVSQSSKRNTEIVMGRIEFRVQDDRSVELLLGLVNQSLGPKCITEQVVRFRPSRS